MTLLLRQMAIAALVSGIITVLLTPLVKRLATGAGVVRAPRARDAHQKPTPLWGGLAMFAGFIATVLLMRLFTGDSLAVARSGEHPILGILAGGTLIAVVGLLDDKYDLSAKAQIAGLLLGGLLAALLGVRINGITNPFVPLDPAGGYTFQNYYDLHGHRLLGVPLSYPVTMIWVFLVAKTFDFLDGLDGLAAGVCAISATTMGLLAAAQGDSAVALLAAALVGACVGFLRHNYNPASIFMGTIGAQFLGFVLAALAVVGAFKIPAAISVFIPLLVLGVPVFDGLFVIAKRLWLRQDPTLPDRTSHIHHRLRNRGLSTRQTVWAIYGLTASFCLLALLLAWKFTR
jgi:UDP-GlcNAc:undecaprenyl-phosphate GlcNAc-1-phosphate transferase